MSAKPARTHVVAPAGLNVADDVHHMLCGMRSTPEHPLVFTNDETLADCSRCLAFTGDRTLPAYLRYGLGR